MNRPAAVLALSAALGTSACASLEPAYHRPPPPAGLTEVTAPSGAAEPAALPDWRQVVVDAKLRTVVDLALRNNLDLPVAVANLSIARAQAEAERAALAPTIALTGAAEGVRGVQGSGGPLVEGQSARLVTVELGLQAYELDLFSRLRSRSRAASEDYAASEEDTRALRITVMGEVANAYVDFAAARTRLQVGRATEINAAASLAIAQRRVDEGIASNLEVRQAQAYLEQSRSAIYAARTVEMQTRNALEALAGGPIADSALPLGLAPDTVLFTPPRPDLPSSLLLTRPDILALERRLMAANARMGAARAAFLPTITLTAAGGRISPTLSRLAASPAGFATAALDIVAPIFDGGANRAGLHLAEGRRSLLVAQYRQALQNALREVADDLAQRATIEDQVAADARRVAAARGSLDIAQARYAQGSDSYLAVLTAERDLDSGLLALNESVATRQKIALALYVAFGGGG